MRKYEALSPILHKICDNVYFQPGSNVHMTYPCIVCEFEGPEDRIADNRHYLTYGKYSLKYIHKSPSMEKFEEFHDLHNCSWDRRFIADGMYHDCWIIYF